MIVRINFEDTYDLLSISSDLKEATFHSYDRKNNLVLMKILIEPLDDALLPEVYNLCFGPPKADGTIDDTIKIPHQDINKLFSTIILSTLTFLTENPKVTIGLDGSNDVRAYLYHRMFTTNRNYLDEYFLALGVDWFVRLLRNNDYERNADGSSFFKPRPEPFDYHRPAKDLYRYYMFHLRNNNN